MEEIYTHKIVEQCQGCQKVNLETNECSMYPYPEPKWEAGKKCPGATHLIKEVKKDEGTKDPLKMSKMKARGLK